MELFDKEQLFSAAREAGFDYVTELDPSLINPLEELRQMCESNRCGNYNKNWACPPGSGTLEELKALCTGYEKGLLVQSVGELEDSFDIEGMEHTGSLHKKRTNALNETLKGCFDDVLPMGAGACEICESCAYPEPCVHPDKRVVSLEAFGVFVSKLCEDCGAKYNHGPNTITYTGCFLLK
ncbi:MAG: DUF2284 domain-containing protein [Christensenellales bacterium]|jgi:predicted metal-binding protein